MDMSKYYWKKEVLPGLWKKSGLEITFAKGGGLRLWDVDAVETIGIYDTLRQAKTAGDNYLIERGVVQLRAWVGDGWKAVLAIRQIRRGKNKHKFEIKYRRGSKIKKAIVRHYAIAER